MSKQKTKKLTPTEDIEYIPLDVPVDVLIITGNSISMAVSRADFEYLAVSFFLDDLTKRGFTIESTLYE